MSMKDTEETNSAYFSFDESDLEEYETKLYSLVYHNSNTYDGDPKSGQCSSTGNDECSGVVNSVESVPNGISLERPFDLTTKTNHQNKFQQSAKSKASRLDQVKTIITIADKKQECEGQPRCAKNNQKKKKMFSRRQNRSKDNPKTASLYFQNLTKSISNAQYLQTVEPRLTKPYDRIRGAKPPPNNSSNYTIDLTHSPGRDRVSLPGFPTRPAEVNGSTSGCASVCRLDPSTPRNASIEEVELSHRLFSIEPSKAPADRSDRHNHLFNQLPTNPIQSSEPLKKDCPPPKTKKKKTPRNKKKNNQAVPPSSAGNCSKFSTDHPGQANPSTTMLADPPQLNSLSDQHVASTSAANCSVSSSGVRSFNESKASASKACAINLSFDTDISLDDIVRLDSDTESVDSVVVITPPPKTPPPMISLDSDDEAQAEEASPSDIPIHPAAVTEHVENSFDFLDGTDDPDTLRKSQVSLLSNMMSNGVGSKESLLDDHLFQPREESVNVEQTSTKPAGTFGQQTVSVAEEVTAARDLPHNEGASAAQTLTKQSLNVHVNASLQSTGPSLLNQVDSSLEVQAQGDELIVSVRNDVFVDVAINITSDSVNSIEAVDLSISHKDDMTNEGGKRKHHGDKEEQLAMMKKRLNSKKVTIPEQQRNSQEVGRTRSTGMEPVEYTKIEGPYSIDKGAVAPRNPPQWTRQMRHFYNDSWGGENFSVQDVQSQMSKHANWRVSWKDIRGPQPLQGMFKRMRCLNCSQFGHPIKHCPEPQRPVVCHWCGVRGHRALSCPCKLCLECGRPGKSFNKGCWHCMENRFPMCTKCIWKHDPSSHCFDIRRNPVRRDIMNADFSDVNYQPHRSDTTCPEYDLRLQLDQKRAKVTLGRTSEPSQAVKANGHGWQPHNSHKTPRGGHSNRAKRVAGSSQSRSEWRKSLGAYQSRKYGSYVPFQKRSPRKSQP